MGNLKNNQIKSLRIKLENEIESVEIAEIELAAQVHFISNEGLLVYEATWDKSNELSERNKEQEKEEVVNDFQITIVKLEDELKCKDEVIIKKNKTVNKLKQALKSQSETIKDLDQELHSQKKKYQEKLKDCQKTLNDK